MRVALYGHGHMGRLYARHLAGHDLVVVDPALGLHGDIDGIDAAVIATPTATHAAVALPLLERGIPCLVEKPLAATLHEARALAGHPHLMVGHIERFNPAYCAIAGVDARFVVAERVGRFTPRGTDVDVILDLMIHDLDLFLHLSGEDVVEVRANGVAVATDGFDLAQARVETVSGRVGTFTASRLARQPARKLRVFATGEYWSVDLRERQVTRVVYEAGELVQVQVPLPVQDALGAEVGAFLAAVRGERPYPVSGVDGLRALELAWRIREAIRG
ncbi:MAG: Gfo/Idh/MocA family oxidoreductase [Pseudomonadota bacterium]|nr:Gfo/Idh/MocA family oxidoreductase [Pseudomonadota bacterium]